MLAQRVNTNPLLLRPGQVINEHATASDAFLCPVPDSDAVTVWILNLLSSGAAVEQLPVRIFGRWRRSVVMPKSVPLGGLLRVKMILIIKSDTRSNPLNPVFERFAAESWQICK